jgi:hypothetical protein
MWTLEEQQLFDRCTSLISIADYGQALTVASQLSERVKYGPARTIPADIYLFHGNARTAPPLQRLALRLACVLRLQNDALQLFKDHELFIGRINLGVALLFGMQKADMLQAFQLTLDIAWVFFDKFS